MIALLGNRKIAQFGYVCNALSNLGVDPLLLDFCSEQRLSFSMSKSGRLSLVLNGNFVDEISCAWRCAKFLHLKFGCAETWVNEYIRGNFQKESYLNFISLHEEVILNRPKMDYFSQRKISQLEFAARSGFRIPRTIVSNSLDDIELWVSGGENFITKCIGDSIIPRIKDGIVSQESIPTCRLSVEYLNSQPSRIEPFHVFIQDEIDKKFEYRCVYINGRIFSFRIDPFQHPIMEVDYRMGGMMVNYEPCDIPDILKSKIIDFSKNIRLFSGCFDFIEDKSGEYYFLEVNPEGIWGLHDEIVDGEISLEVARQLLKISNENRSTKSSVFYSRCS